MSLISSNCPADAVYEMRCTACDHDWTTPVCHEVDADYDGQLSRYIVPEQPHCPYCGELGEEVDCYGI